MPAGDVKHAGALADRRAAPAKDAKPVGGEEETPDTERLAEARLARALAVEAPPRCAKRLDGLGAGKVCAEELRVRCEAQLEAEATTAPTWQLSRSVEAKLGAVKEPWVSVGSVLVS